MLLVDSEGRYDRQELITWWNQEALRAARILVVGAGALGNEVVKNLTLLGIGHITVVDMDSVSTSNLSRCVFFREGDEGQPKADLVAARASALNPDVKVIGIISTVQSQGVGWLAEFDLVIGCLDNREARVWVNQACRKFGLTWIDGAIEGIRGVVKVFPPVGPCYECTLGEVDRAILEKRKACSLLTEEEVELGKVPTNATTSSVIAGLQSQEAVRILNGMASPLNNRGWFIIGESFDSYTVDYQEDEWCPAHETYESRVLAPYESVQTLRSLVELFAPGAEAFEVEFESILVRGGTCFECNTKSTINRLVGAVSQKDVTCGGCAAVMGLDVTTVISNVDDLLDSTLAQLSIPFYDVVRIRTAETQVIVAFTGEKK